MAFSKISVIGLGYIGLPTAAILASRKVEVIGVDVNANAVETINQGRIHIAEPFLEAVVHDAVQSGHLRATTKPEPADAYLIAVPTPFHEGEGRGNVSPDLSYVEAASNAVAKVLKPGDLVVLESTSPVGTTEAMAEWMASARPDLTFPQQKGEASDIRIAYCPERVLPGQVLRELVENDRVIGGMTPACATQATSLYRTFVEGNCLETNARTAEMVKLTENSFRDVNIALANELSLICDRLDINVWELIRLANHHPRVNILQPGPGVGGHCIAVDPWFIVSQAPEQARIIRAARDVNDSKPDWVIDKVLSKVADLRTTLGREPILACYGLAFKPDIDDLRESPALAIVKRLDAVIDKAMLTVEPNISELPIGLVNSRLASADEAQKSADLHVFLVRHKEFLMLGLSPEANRLDFCGLLNNYV